MHREVGVKCLIYDSDGLSLTEIEALALSSQTFLVETSVDEGSCLDVDQRNIQHLVCLKQNKYNHANNVEDNKLHDT